MQIYLAHSVVLNGPFEVQERAEGLAGIRDVSVEIKNAKGLCRYLNGHSPYEFFEITDAAGTKRAICKAHIFEIIEA